MILLIAGSRSFNDYEFLKEKIDSLTANVKITKIITGGEIGTDQLAEQYAKEKNIKVEIKKPRWKIGRSAGYLRNEDMVRNSNSVICFWDGRSRGTKHILQLAEAYKIQRRIIYFGINYLYPL